MKALRYLTIFIFIAGFSAPSFGDWETINLGTTAEINDITFFDALNGWAVGDSSTIFATKDGGRHWERQFISKIPAGPQALWLNKLQFLSPEIGFIAAANGVVLSTRDGGTTWTGVKVGTDSLGEVSNLFFVDPDTGWATRNEFSSRGYTVRRGLIYRTDDGGLTWRKQFQSDLFHAIRFLDKRTGWALASYNMDNFNPSTVYHTEDGGETWQDFGAMHCYPHKEQMIIVSPDTLWAFDYGFAISCDGGHNWEWQGKVDNVRDIYSLGHNRAIMYSFAINKWSSILYTEDGWNTFTELCSVPQNGINALSMAGENTIWVVGRKGTMMKYTFPGTAVSENVHPCPLELHPNIPNPFNPATTISFTLPRAGNATLAVYDITGRKVVELARGFHPAGKHAVVWNARDCASGVYFYTLRAENRTETRKMLLVR